MPKSEHAMVMFAVSHPEGLSAHHEQVVADAVTEAIKKVEAHGVQVGYRHTHLHTHSAGK